MPRIVGWPATSTLSLTNVGTPLKKPLDGSADAVSPGLLECLVRQAVQGGVDGLGAGDGRLDDVGPADPTGRDGVGEADRVEITEGIVTESVHASHSTTLAAHVAG